MLTIKTRLGPSPIHGIGLFAAQDILSCQTVWEFDPDVDQTLSPQQIAKAPTLRKYAWFDKEAEEIFLAADDARFFNHSSTPNVIGVAGYPFFMIAARDIKCGEELTEDYFAFDGWAEEKLSSGEIGEAKGAA